MLKVVLKRYSDSEADVYQNIEEYNQEKNRQVLIGFDDIIADMISNKKQ